MKASEKTAITARTNDTSGWKTFWDGTLTSRANVLKAKTDAALINVSYADRSLFLLAFYGYIEETGRPANGYKDRAIKGAVYMAGLPDDVNPTGRRERLSGLMNVFDFCYDDMTTAERNTIAAEMIQQQARMTQNSAEQMDGHSGTDQAVRIGAMLTLHGYSTYASAAASNLQDALEFWYGASAGVGRIEMERYQYTNGGMDKGGWYAYQAFWGFLLLLQFMTKATTHDAWSNESSYLSKAWEWILWTGFRGGVDDDFEAQGDTAKVTNPKMHILQRWTYGLLATNYPTPNSAEGGKHLRWLYDVWDAQQSEFGEDKVFDVLFLDRAGVAPIEPKNGTPVPAASRLFDPPGYYYYRESGRGTGNPAWDYENSVLFRVGGRRRFRQGHPHFDQGSVMIRFKDDVLLQAPAGYYDDFGTSHHVDAYQRGWLQSLTPLIYDPSQSYQRYSQSVVNDGGPHFKKATRTGGVIASDPDTVANMLGEAGGEAWLCSRKFTKVTDDSNFVFVSLECADAYKKFYTDQPRCPILEIRYLVIKPTASNGLTYPALLYYARIKKRDGAWKVQIPFHCGAAITPQSFGFTALGYRTTAANGSPGKLWVDVRGVASYTLTHNPPGTPLDANGYGPDQFRVAGTGVNRPPSEGIPARHVADLKHSSIYLERTSKVEEEHYVCLLMVNDSAGGDPQASRSWVSDAAQPNFYGVTLGSSTYLLSRTEDLAVFGTPDSSPPANVTGMSVTARDKALFAQWTDPADSDYRFADVYYRTSAI
jgi:hypothetical protein